MKRRLAAAALMASLALAPAAGAAPNPVPASRASVTCTLRTTSNGRRICFCRANRPGSWWQSYPLFFCRIVR